MVRHADVDQAPEHDVLEPVGDPTHERARQEKGEAEPDRRKRQGTALNSDGPSSPVATTAPAPIRGETSSAPSAMPTVQIESIVPYAISLRPRTSWTKNSSPSQTADMNRSELKAIVIARR